ncbi:MAG: hypothetical protein H0Z39_11310 [Peptococcaceae bacterium]|nr:hypothetical protein [Peptococcaceae bacterium]
MGPVLEIIKPEVVKDESPSKTTRGGVGVCKKLTVKEMEKALGFDKVKPIELSPSDARQFEEKGDPFKDWYEEELRTLFKDSEKDSE